MLKIIEKATQLTKIKDIGLVSRFIVLAKETNRVTITNAPNKGAAGIIQDESNNVAIEVNSSIVKKP